MSVQSAEHNCSKCEHDEDKGTEYCGCCDGQNYQEAGWHIRERLTKQIADQQAVINELKIQNTNLAIVVQENSELHHKQITGYQGRIEQLVKACKRAKERIDEKHNPATLQVIDAALAAAKEKE